MHVPHLQGIVAKQNSEVHKFESAASVSPLHLRAVLHQCQLTKQQVYQKMHVMVML